MLYRDRHNLLKLKAHSRHYYLGQASFYLRRGDNEEVQTNLQVVERMQIEIDRLEQEIANHKEPVLERMW